ncbi:uncharacterized protein K460DRAFT_367298 [Cucurbitaria berberidis CBS 394.84]|uniref:F-box domain-containing protein n=1 Tax=Cucurbitaria berberidis CBS 394.84 TaxID=1168544 RepID=A0A9P4L9L6_9PLEO|nr:uncharacterized protein K460DRAFT_367298 [Cucurbitaria berberidis CBS 394.84]KAF1846548.1 hypothetical protein K460DRAFT_367298 [Cucurbitaria berberidis CBS 394.84]
MVAKAGVTKRRVSNVTPASASNVPSMSLMEDLFGDEFPEAFATSSGYAARSSKRVTDLPAELLAMICEHLSNLDIKRLRLAGKHLAKNVGLRIDRIYISPNRANLDCLQRILDHPRYRNDVGEIVWDDAQLEEYPTLDSFRHAIGIDEVKTTIDIENRLDEAIRGHEDDSPEYRALERDDFFSSNGQLTEVGKGILLRYDDQFSRDIIARSTTVMSIEQSYNLYQRLYQEEQEIMEQQLDVAALHRAIAGFPKMKRITLTSEVWRPWKLYPLYDTPFYRSLPPGFRKPSVWPWLGFRQQATSVQAAHRDEVMSTRNIERLSIEFRGYSIIVSTLLAIPNPKIEEIIIDAGNEYTGISHQLFASPNSDFEATVRMFQLVPLKGLQLVINPYCSDSNPDSLFASGLLKRALAEAQFLEHFDFNPHWLPRTYRHETLDLSFGPNEVLPEATIKRLTTFALRNVSVKENDLEDLLKEMENVEHVTLDNIHLKNSAFLHHQPDPSWVQLFHRLQSYYAASPMVSHPRFAWIEPTYYGRNYFVDEEIGDFLYRGAECPFENGLQRPLKEGVGWFVDERDKGFKVRRLVGVEGW